MKCPHCSQERPDGTKYCPETGHLMPFNVLSCPNQNCTNYKRYVLPSDSKFCPDCGTSLNGITKDKRSDAIEGKKNDEASPCFSDLSRSIDIGKHEPIAHLFSFSCQVEEDFLNPLVIRTYLGENIHQISDESITFDKDFYGHETCQFLYKHISITCVADYTDNIKMFIFKNITFEDLCVLFELPNDILDIKNLRSILTIEDVDGINFNYVDFFSDLRFYLRFRKDGSVRHVLVEKFRNKEFLSSVFPIHGIVLGETSVRQLYKQYEVTHNGDETYCNIKGIIFSFPQNASKVCTMTIANNVEMPQSMLSWGFDWQFSYDKYLDILKERGLSSSIWKKERPKVISKKGRSMLKADICVSLDEFIECTLIFDMGNKNGEGCSTSSNNSLYKIIFTYLE